MCLFTKPALLTDRPTKNKKILVRWICSWNWIIFFNIFCMRIWYVLIVSPQYKTQVLIWPDPALIKRTTIHLDSNGFCKIEDKILRIWNTYYTRILFIYTICRIYEKYILLWIIVRVTILFQKISSAYKNFYMIRTTIIL